MRIEHAVQCPLVIAPYAELARNCGMPANNIAVEKEPEGVNFFLRIKKR